MTSTTSFSLVERRVTGSGSEALVPAVPPRMGVHSEAGVLRTVVLDGRLATTTPALGEALAARGIRVLMLDGLLADVLSVGSVLQIMAERVSTLEAASPVARRRIRSALLRADPDEAAHLVLHGIPASDRDRDPRSPERARYLLPPLPDARSLRQSLVAVTPRPLVALHSAREARRSIAVMSAIWQAHPAFADSRPRRYRADPELPRVDAVLDGDDVQTAPDGTVVVAVGHRSNRRGARQLALSVLGAPGAPPRVVVVSIATGPVDRLDGLIAFLGRRTALVHPVAYSDDALAWELRAGDESTGPALRAHSPRPFREVLPSLLDSDGTTLTVPASRGASGPQHLLAVEPGAVLTSARPGDTTTELLERAGVEVALVNDDGPAARVGGLRRIVLPVERDAVREASGPTAL